MRYFIPVVLGMVVSGMGFSADLSAAEIYKCRQTDGSIQYSDQPCPEADSVEKLDIESKRTDPQAVEKRRQERLARYEALQDREAKEAEESAAAREAAAERGKQCSQARNVLQKLVSENRLYTGEGDNRQYMSAEQIENRRKQAQEKVDELCGN